jgi:hypothetical protein
VTLTPDEIQQFTSNVLARPVTIETIVGTAAQLIQEAEKRVRGSVNGSREARAFAPTPNDHI